MWNDVSVLFFCLGFNSEVQQIDPRIPQTELESQSIFLDLVEIINDGKNSFDSGMQEINILRKILTNQAVRFFVRSVLPGGVWVGKVKDIQASDGT